MKLHSLLPYLLLLFVGTTLGVSNLTIYDGVNGQLVNGFQSWSWAPVNLVSTEFVSTGNQFSISADVKGYAALYLHTFTSFTEMLYKSVRFSINGGYTGGQPVIVQAISGSSPIGSSVTISTVIGKPIPARSWVVVEIPLASFKLPVDTLLHGFWWQGQSDDAGTIYLDDLMLVGGPPPPITPVSVVVSDASKMPLSELIFGVNWASTAQIQKNSYTFNRWGGNAVTRYAYDVDANNRASDWFFESLPNDNNNPPALPYNSSSDRFIRDTFNGNALPLITIPTIGFAPIDRLERCSFSVAKYGPQQRTDPYWPDCGNGVKLDGQVITGNDWRDANRMINETYILRWLQHLEGVFGRGRVNYFTLDNEPGIWHETHRDVHPNPLTYDELWNKTVTYAGAIKRYYPNSIVFGPVPWGWCEYMFSSADGCTSGPDRAAHGDIPLLEWYIKQVGAYRSQYGIQLVDVIDVHIYPQVANVDSSLEDDVTADLRFRSIRGLWDRTYSDDSWIQQPIYLIPRLQQWIDIYAPGLPIAITEYNWGGDNIITGALAQVVILGVFARENVWAANRWVVPDSNSKTEEAFRLYTNYDGKGGKVEGNVVSVTVDNVDEVEAFAFVGKNVYVVIVNKRGDGPVPVTVNVRSVTQKATATIYGFSKTQALAMLGTETITNGSFTTKVGPWTAEIAVIPL